MFTGTMGAQSLDVLESVRPRFQSLVKQAHEMHLNTAEKWSNNAVLFPDQLQSLVYTRSRRAFLMEVAQPDNQP